MREREQKTAQRFGVLERMEALEREIRKIDHVVDIDFDLNGFWSDINQVILIPKYDIPLFISNYYDVRREMLNQILAVSKSYGLHNSGDRIEDYGEHLYIVRDCDRTWQLSKTEQESVFDSQNNKDDKVSLTERVELAAAQIAKSESFSETKEKDPSPER